MLLPAGFALPTPDEPVLISDTTAASSNFAVFNLIQLAQERGIPTTLVDFRQEGAASHTAVLRKLGIKPPSFLTPSPLPSAQLALFTSSGPPLQATFAALPKSGLVILDGLSELESIGFSPLEISRFVRAVRDSGVLLAFTLRADLTAEEEKEVEQPELLRRLLRIAGVWWRIQGLQSGRSADVTGEISRHTLNGKGEDVGRQNPLQYRLEIAGVKTFAKGTGRGYL